MRSPPEQIGGARVVCFSPIDGRHQPTGDCQHFIAGGLAPPAAGLAICWSEGEDAYYLFGCDAQWNAVTDTWHETLEEAKHQAEFEYRGVSETRISLE